MKATAQSALALVAAALAACPAGLSSFTLTCLPPEACPPGATCVCTDGGEPDAGGGTTSGGSGGSSSGHSVATSSSSAGTSGSSSGQATSAGGSSSGGSSSGTSAGPDAGGPCNPSGPPGTPVVLASLPFGAIGMTAQNGWLYYTVYDGDVQLFGLDVDGGQPVLLGTLPVDFGTEFLAPNVTADSAHVYWTNGNSHFADGEVAEVLLDGGGETTLAFDQAGPISPAVDATNLYWVAQGSGDGGTVWKLPLAGGPAIQLASSKTPYYLAVNASAVFWSSLGDGLEEVPIDGGAVTRLVTLADVGAGLAVDANSLYFGVASSVEAVSVNGGVASDLAADQIYPGGLLVADGTLYWANSGTGAQDGTIMELPIGCPAPIVLASGQALPVLPTVDATSIYWVSGSGSPYQIMRLTPR